MTPSPTRFDGPRPGSFTVADLNAKGEIRSKAVYDYAALELVPGAGELIGHLAGQLYANPDEFESPLPDGSDHLVLRWRSSADTAGIATLRCHGQIAVISLLASGRDRDADQLTLEAAQTHLLRELHDTGYEPAFGLTEIPDRPLVATINLHTPPNPTDRLLAALADRCFAAAYFRYQGLA